MKNLKTKSLISILLATFLAISMVSSINFAQAATVVSVDPSLVDISTNPTLALGDTFVATVKISDVTDLWGWNVKLSYNPAVLQVQGVPQQGAFLSAVGATFWAQAVDNGLGTAEGNAVLLSTDNADGSGNLMTVTFKVVGYGSTDIAVVTSQLLQPDAAHTNIVHTTAGSTFNLPPPPPQGPQARFVVNGTYFKQGIDSITLDASSSVAGYDTLGVAEICPITSYQWSIDFGNNGVDATFTGATATIPASAVGEVKITLTVTAPDPTAPSHADYVTTSTTNKIVNVILPPLGASIDVYTARGGVGPNARSDAYGPQELVNLYALVTYNNVPVVNKDVAFEIFNQNGVAIAYRTARTNGSGIAATEYRTMWPDTATPEIIFGNWSVVATVDVSQVVKTDTVNFTFAYLITIDNAYTMTTTNNPQGSFARTNVVKVNVTLTNIRTIDLPATVTIVIYDECDVPVGVYTVETNVNAQDSTWIAGTISIPTYAFVGQAVVYVNSLTALPSLQGIPYCPETAVPFMITA
jgi:hypothetical protein